MLLLLSFLICFYLRKSAAIFLTNLSSPRSPRQKSPTPHQRVPSSVSAAATSEWCLLQRRELSSLFQNKPLRSGLEVQHPASKKSCSRQTQLQASVPSHERRQCNRVSVEASLDRLSDTHQPSRCYLPDHLEAARSSSKRQRYKPGCRQTSTHARRVSSSLGQPVLHMRRLANLSQCLWRCTRCPAQHRSVRTRTSFLSVP